MPDRLITLERQLAALAESVENYAANQNPSTFDVMEREMLNAKKMLNSKNLKIEEK